MGNDFPIVVYQETLLCLICWPKLWHTAYVSSCEVDVGDTMQLYHHPFSVDSQKVRLALEENGVDYTSYHINPITGKNMEASFFRMNPSGKLPVFQNGSHILYNTIEILQ